MAEFSKYYFASGLIMFNAFPHTLFSILFIAVSLIPSGTMAESSDNSESFLVIESGMHVAPIWRIGTDKDCKKIVTASKDKTVRLWETPTKNGESPKLVDTLRATIGPGNEGKFRSVAMSADGSLIAAGAADWGPGRGGPWVYIFDAKTGEIIKALKINQQPNDLAFSPDGTKLAVALHGAEGHMVWETQDWKEIKAQDPTSTRESRSYGLAFDSTGEKLWTVAYDKKLRQYKYTSDLNDSKNTLEVDGPSLSLTSNKPYALAIHPNNSMIAVAYNDDKISAVEVFLSDDLDRGPVYSARGANPTDMFLAVAWSSDGKRLWGGGRPEKEIEHGPNPYPLYYWEHKGFVNPQKFASSVTHPIILYAQEVKDPKKGPANSVIDLVPCGNKVALGAQDPAFFVMDAEGKRLFEMIPAGADMRGKIGSDFTASEDGSRVRFNLTWGGLDEDFVLFDLSKGTVKRSPSKPSDLSSANVNDLKIPEWKNESYCATGTRTYCPTLNGEKLYWKDTHEAPRSLAISQHKPIFALGAEWSLYLYDNKGNFIDRKPSPNVVWGVTIAQKGELAVAAYGDGTIRWIRLPDLEELLALYVYPPNPNRWVAWTPKGYYKASGGGELIGWHSNRGRKQKAEFYWIGQFRREFDRPDIVKQVLETLDEEKAISLANTISNRPRAVEEVTKILPPILSIVPPKNNTFKNPKVQLKYSVQRSFEEKPVFIKVLVNGEINTRIGHVDGKQDLEITVPFEILHQKNKMIDIELIPYIREGPGNSAHLKLKWIGEPITQNYTKPTLWAVLIGVSYEKNTVLKKLDYAHQDAEDMKIILEDQEGIFYKKVNVWPYINSNATRKNILDSLLDLYDESVKEENKKDIFLFFFSGHGKLDRSGKFFLVPSGADVNTINSEGVPGTEIIERIQAMSGKKIVMIDACRSADVNISSIENSFRDNKVINGTIFIASSGGPFEEDFITDEDNIAYECSKNNKDCNNGFFTFALRQAFEGKANSLLDPDEFIDTDELKFFVKRKVREITQKKQTPVIWSTWRLPTFKIGHVPKNTNVMTNSPSSMEN